MYKNGQSSRQAWDMSWSQGNGGSNESSQGSEGNNWSQGSGDSNGSQGSRDNNWPQGSGSSNNSFQCATRMNTVLVTNIQPQTTLKELLEKIAIAGPFGKLYSAHLRPVSNPRQDPTSRALITFFSKEAVVHFLAYVCNQGICTKGRPIRAAETETPAPETIEPEGPRDSRVVILQGYTLEEGSSCRSYITTYADANLLVRALAPAKTNRAYYGRDPIEAGVRTGYDYMKSIPGDLHIEVYIVKWFYEENQEEDSEDYLCP
ncbi:hypothetical protein QBC37DRAFT_374975 [Rhypophila decipiens]|uniref:RRM domain-containing protein n=1 Tax=Rhypophila decipiens TaxID=261697 RepID=A0AAN6Y9I0_9PEZI|nr:hypothetical protein QBC37DRAFT_374975 [Rhypophila decipiens]